VVRVRVRDVRSLTPKFCRGAPLMGYLCGDGEGQWVDAFFPCLVNKNISRFGRVLWTFVENANNP